jgi:hypothetical protein
MAFRPSEDENTGQEMASTEDVANCGHVVVKVRENRNTHRAGHPVATSRGGGRTRP